jgi:hypothetical protein
LLLASGNGFVTSCQPATSYIRPELMSKVAESKQEARCQRPEHLKPLLFEFIPDSTTHQFSAGAGLCPKFRFVNLFR